jgi:hypothetical protein
MKRILILLKSGALCIYKYEKDTALLERIVQPGSIKDSEGKHTGSS